MQIDTNCEELEIFIYLIVQIKYILFQIPKLLFDKKKNPKLLYRQKRYWQCIPILTNTSKNLGKISHNKIELIYLPQKLHCCHSQ